MPAKSKARKRNAPRQAEKRAEAQTSSEITDVADSVDQSSVAVGDEFFSTQEKERQLDMLSSTIAAADGTGSTGVDGSGLVTALASLQVAIGKLHGEATAGAAGHGTDDSSTRRRMRPRSAVWPTW